MINIIKSFWLYAYSQKLNKGGEVFFYYLFNSLKITMLSNYILSFSAEYEIQEAL